MGKYEKKAARRSPQISQNFPNPPKISQAAICHTARVCRKSQRPAKVCRTSLLFYIAERLVWSKKYCIKPFQFRNWSMIFITKKSCFKLNFHRFGVIFGYYISTNMKGKKQTEKHLNWKIVYSIKRLSQQITTKEQSLPDNAFLCRVLCIHGAFLLCICWDAVVSVLRGADRNAPLFLRCFP